MRNDFSVAITFFDRYLRPMCDVTKIEDGWNTLVVPNKEKIIEAINHFEPKGKQRDILGDGKVAKRIVPLLRV
jgi:hypothetical protein